MKILVTGGAGFLGSWIVQCLCDEGHEVVVLDDLSSGVRENLDQRVRFFKGSVCDPSKVESIMQIGFDCVIHAAAYAAERYSHYIRRYIYWQNVIGSLNVINCAVNAGVKRFVFISSIAVYGEGPTPFVEEQECKPVDPYGVAKLAVELDLKAACRHFGMEYTIFRPHNVIGPRQSLNDPARNVAAIFIRQALEKKPFTIIGDGNQIRCFSPVLPVARCIAASVSMPGCANQTFNVGSNECRSVNDLAMLVAELTGWHEFEHLPAQDEVREARSSHTNIQTAIPQAWLKEDTIEFTLKMMIMAAGEGGVGEMRTLPKAEITKNLPEVWK